MSANLLIVVERILLVFVFLSTIVSCFLFFVNFFRTALVFRIYALTCLLIGLWTGVHFVGYFTSSPAVLISLAKVSLASASLIPSALALLALTLSPDVDKIKYRHFFLYFPGVVFAILAFTDLSYAGFSSGIYAYTHIKHGVLYVFFSPYFILFMLIAILLFLRSRFLIEDESNRRVASVVLLSLAVSAIVGVLFNAVVPSFTDFVPSPYVGPAVAFFFLVATGFSLLRYRIFGLGLLLMRRHVYNATLFTFFLIVLTIPLFTLQSYGFTFQFLFTLALACLMLLFYLVFSERLEGLFSRFFSRSYLDLHRLNSEEKSILIKTNLKGRFIEDFLKVLPASQYTEELHFFFYEHDTESYSLVSGALPSRYYSMSESWIQEIEAHDTFSIHLDESDNLKALRVVLDEYKSNHVISFRQDGRLLGFAFLLLPAKHDFNLDSEGQDQFTSLCTLLWSILQSEHVVRKHISKVS